MSRQFQEVQTSLLVLRNEQEYRWGELEQKLAEIALKNSQPQNPVDFDLEKISQLVDEKVRLGMLQVQKVVD